MARIVSTMSPIIQLNHLITQRIQTHNLDNTSSTDLNSSHLEYTQLHNSPTRSQLINDDLFQILLLLFEGIVFITSSLLGIAANTINIIVYTKQGFQDSITLGFFVLSASDLVLSACPLGLSARYIADRFLPDYIHIRALYFVSLGQIREMAFYFSNILTAFLSVERCVCVVFPFHVKTIFTFGRSRAIIIFLFSLVIVCYGPVLSTIQIRWMYNPVKNGTQYLGLWFAPHRQIVTNISFRFISVFSTFVSVSVVICSMTIMMYGLRENSKFRQKMAATTVSNRSKGSTNDSTSGKGKGKGSDLSERDARLVKVMIFIGAIFTTSNLPYLAFVIAMMNVKILNFGKAYHNTFIILYHINYFLSTINASTNVFVYYFNSSRYRAICRQLFPCLGASKNTDKTKTTKE